MDRETDRLSEEGSLISDQPADGNTAVVDHVTISVESSSPTEEKEESPFKRTRKKVDFFGVGNEDSDSDGSSSPVVKFNIPLNKTSKKAMNNSRYHQPRMSLLGKPIEYKQRKWGIRYRKLQAKIYNFLERPKDWLENIYHVGTFLLVLVCIGLSIFTSIPEYNPLVERPLFFLEIGMVVWLITEYSLRMWSAGCRSRYQGPSGRFKFARRPLCIVDMIVIIATAVLVLVSAAQGNLFLNTLQALRFFQILRLVRMDRRGNTWKLLGSVMWAHRKELLTSLYMGLIGLLLSSFLLHLAEKDANHKFATLADSLWWGVITLCTVGYGDTVPLTWPGKLIAGLSAVCCISFFALPAGILGSGFALKVQQEQRQKHQIRRRVPAAILIQCLWKCYAADENSLSVATWKPHMKPCPSPTMFESVFCREHSRLKHQPSFVSRFSSRKGKDKEKANNNMCNGQSNPNSPGLNRPRKDGVVIPMSESMDLFNKSSHLSLTLTDKDVQIGRGNGKSNHNEDDSEDTVFQLTDVHKRAIRAIRKISYYVARRRFREALRPYDVKDVMEQYSAGHADMLARVKSLQGRLDTILGKSGSKAKDVYESKQSLASRIVGVERKVDDIESKLDTLLDLYVEDRKRQLGITDEPVTTEADTNTRNSTSSPLLLPPTYKPERAKIRKHVTYHGPHGGRRHLQAHRTNSSPGMTLNGTVENNTDHTTSDNKEAKDDLDVEAEPLLRPEVIKLRKEMH